MKRFLPGSEFGRNVLTLTAGTTIAQAIPIAMMPVLTRIYTPEDFGIFALYSAIVAILATAITGRYELAVTLPDNHEDADHLVWLSLGIALTGSFVLFLIVLGLGDTISHAFNTPELGTWLYFIPVSILLVGTYNTINYWFNRHQRYVGMSKNRVVQSTSISGIQAIAGLLKAGTAGLIIGNLIGQLITTVMMLRVFLAHVSAQPTAGTGTAQLKALAHRYRNHPYHLMPSHWIGSAAMQMPVFIISSTFGAATVGFFALANRMVTMPSSIIANAIGDVYRQQASIAYQEQGEFKQLFLSTLLKTIGLSVIPFGVLYWVAPDFFAMVFGEPWRVAGEYARLVIIAAFFQFIFTPVDKGALIVGATLYILFWHLARLALLTGVLVIAIAYQPDIHTIILLISAATSLLYITDGIVEYQLSKGSDHDRSQR